MKFELRQEQIKSLIENYLNNNYEPDYGWGPGTFDLYKTQIKIWKYYNFLINDIDAFTYYSERHGAKNVLRIEPWVYDELTALFNNIWIPVFIKWFEKNSGLKVFTIDTV